MKRVRDIIYGFIFLDDQECEVVDHPFFQRLRRIKQLSLTDMVYPGATHTRFEHSLGVMQMASDMYDKIVQKSKDILKLYKINKEEDIKKYRKIVRFAALLHDIGHSPFSHAGEDLMPLDNKGDKIKHETYSISIIKAIFKEIIEKNNFNIKVEDVTVLLGDTTVLLGDTTVAPTGPSTLFSQIISGQIDADRADYLLRDSLHIGVKYGIYDHQILINSLRIFDVGDIGPRIVIEELGFHAAENLLIARYLMFTQVYFHKVRRIYDFHLYKACKEILKSISPEKPFYPTPDKIDDYFKFDDWFMQSKFAEFGGEHGKVVLNRRHWKCEHSTDIDPNLDVEIKKIKKKYSLYYVDKNQTNAWYQDADEIIILEKDGKKCTHLTKKSKVVEALKNKAYFTRVFVSRGKE